MTDLAEFLLARIAEDEAVAQAAQPDDGVWYASGESHLDTDAEEQLLLRYSPARVLAECEAKRRIVTRWEFAVGQASNADEGWEMIAGALEDCVLSLALPYADHPDYREEWRP